MSQVINPGTGLHTFDEQVALAKAIQKYRGQVQVPPKGMWDDSKPTADPGNLYAPRGIDSMDAIQNTLSDSNFGEFVEESYSAPEGYAIRYNPVTGKKEMMVAGTRHNTQWLLNAFDSGLYLGDKALKLGANTTIDMAFGSLHASDPTGLTRYIPTPHVKGIDMLEKADPWRQEKQKYYAEIAKDNNIEVIYGHSRGGAMVADMKLPKGMQKVGLDSAMLIAHHTGMLNINEGGGYNPFGLFDAGIGMTGKNNQHFDKSAWSPHKVWKT